VLSFNENKVVYYTRFPVTSRRRGKTADLLRTCYGETGVMDFGLTRMSTYFLE